MDMKKAQTYPFEGFPLLLLCLHRKQCCQNVITCVIDEGNLACLHRQNLPSEKSLLITFQIPVNAY